MHILSAGRYKDHTLLAFCQKKFKGGQDNRPLFSKQYAIVSIVLYIFLENFRGAKVILRGCPLPPPHVAETSSTATGRREPHHGQRPHKNRNCHRSRGS